MDVQVKEFNNLYILCTLHSMHYDKKKIRKDGRGRRVKNNETRARKSPSASRVERPPPPSPPLARWCCGGIGGSSTDTRRARRRCGSRSPYRFRAPPSHRSSSGAGLAAAGYSLLPSHQPTGRPTTAADNINPPGPPTQACIYI